MWEFLGLPWQDITIQEKEKSKSKVKVKANM